jgi:uncharacterized protein (DUF1499 family)
MLWWLLLLLVPLLVAGALHFAARHSRATPPTYGLVEGQLRPCPSTPNCVASEQGPSRAEQRVAPLRLDGRSPEEAWNDLQRAVRAEGGELAVVTNDYLVATVRTPLFGFIDDLEARLDQSAGMIHLRSASRVGRSDFGANRKRVARITALFDEGRHGREAR